jgi:hypothetical protein
VVRGKYGISFIHHPDPLVIRVVKSRRPSRPSFSAWRSTS